MKYIVFSIYKAAHCENGEKAVILWSNYTINCSIFFLSLGEEVTSFSGIIITVGIQSHSVRLNSEINQRTEQI